MNLKLKIVENVPSKIKLHIDQQANGVPDPFTAMIEVTEAGYVPDYVKLRATIGEGTIITADIPHAAFEKLEADPKVKSVGTGSRFTIPEA